MGAQVQVMFVTRPASIQYVRAGKLRALAVTSGTRSEALPEVPTVGEFPLGYEASAWFGVGVPKKTPGREQGVAAVQGEGFDAKHLPAINNFIARIMAHDPRVGTRRSGKGGKNGRHLLGLKLRADDAAQRPGAF